MINTDGEIDIIGGGPIGLLTGILLLKKGYDITIYEEDREIGAHPHCTGIVSLHTLSLYPVDKKKIVANTLYGVRLRISQSFLEEYIASTPKAIVIDRVTLEKELARKFLDLGGVIEFGRRIDTKEIERLRRRDKYIINAGGARELIMGGYREVLPGLQWDIEISEDTDWDEDITEIYIDKALNREYFNWFTPLGNRFFRLGTASSKDLESKIKRLIEIYTGRRGSKLSKRSGLIIYGGPRKQFFNGNIIYVGDSAGMAKITTGGGLNYGAIGADILSTSIYEGDIKCYRERWLGTFKTELTIQRLLREAFTKLDDNQISQIFSILSRKEVMSQLLQFGEMDHHATSLYKIMVDKDILKIMLKMNILPGLIKRLFTKV
jgi:flavin-dependent dehydrogenase